MNVTDFDAERPRLTAIAIRILGSEADADDVLQEAWLRLSRTNDIDDLPAWLTTVVTRLCLDHLRKRRTRSEAEAEAREGRPHTDEDTEAWIARRRRELSGRAGAAHPLDAGDSGRPSVPATPPAGAGGLSSSAVPVGVAGPQSANGAAGLSPAALGSTGDAEQIRALIARGAQAAERTA